MCGYSGGSNKVGAIIAYTSQYQSTKSLAMNLFIYILLFLFKNDRGLPLGVQDASVFNIDNKLSLQGFQTFIKSKLTCTVKVKAVPRSWRLRRDKFSFLEENKGQSKSRGRCSAQLCRPSCYDAYNETNYGKILCEQ